MQNKSKIVKILMSLIISIWTTFPLYILLHEAGHALISILCGAKIIRLSILRASVTSEGGLYSIYTKSLMHIAGMLFPVLIVFLYMLFYRRHLQNIFYRIFSCFFCLIPTFSILTWVIIPLLYITGHAPLNDDVTRFLDASGIYPLWITIGSFLLQLFIIILAWRKGVFKNYWYTIKLAAVKDNISRT